jgi:hypothetical protein
VTLIQLHTCFTGISLVQYDFHLYIAKIHTHYPSKRETTEQKNKRTKKLAGFVSNFAFESFRDYKAWFIYLCEFPERPTSQLNMCKSQLNLGLTSGFRRVCENFCLQNLSFWKLGLPISLGDNRCKYTLPKRVLIILVLANKRLRPLGVIHRSAHVLLAPPVQYKGNRHVRFTAT